MCFVEEKRVCVDAIERVCVGEDIVNVSKIKGN